MIPDLPIINQLLLKLTRLSFTEEEKTSILYLLNNLEDHKQFLWMANQHGITALLYWNLRDLDLLNKLPKEISSALYNSWLKSLSRNTKLQEGFETIKEILKEAGIEAVPIKGMALEPTVYGNNGLRQMTDCDFLVDSDRCMEAWELLISLGYKPKLQKSRLYKKIYQYYGKHLPELDKDGISFEIHHKLFDLSPEPLISEISENQRISVYPHFLFLIKHLDYHESIKGESQLRLYSDLCQIMMQCTKDIKETGILTLAHEYGLTHLFLAKIWILHTFWEIQLPDECNEMTQTIDKEKVIADFLKFLEQPKGQKPALRKATIYRKTIRAIPGIHRKLIYITGDLFPSLSYMKERYQAKTLPGTLLRYPHRFGKLLYLFSSY